VPRRGVNAPSPLVLPIFDCRLPIEKLSQSSISGWRAPRVRIKICFMRALLQCMRRCGSAACFFLCGISVVTATNHPATSNFAALSRQFQSAVAYYQHQQYARAGQVAGRLLQQVPNSFDVNELMGLIYAAQYKPAHASRYLAKAVRLKPGSAEARMYLAATLTALHQYARAEGEFKKAVELEPAGYDTNHNLGEYYVTAGRLPEAIPYLRKAQQIEPASYNNGYDLALAWIKSGEYGEAKAEVQRLLRYKNAGDLHSLLAVADEKTGQYLQAAKEYELAARMSPTEQNIFAWGTELLLHHTLEPAVQVFQRGVDIYPRSAELQVGLGIALYSQTHYQEAVNAFCRAIDLDPSDPRPYQFLGKIYDVSPLQAQAVTARFARFAELQPHNPQALYNYALSLWKASRMESKSVDLQKVESLLENAVQLDPGFAEGHLQLGMLYFRQHRYPDAILQYRQAVRLEPDLADAHYHLGETLVRTGRRVEAQQEFRIFARLHAEQVQEREKQRSGIMQFVVKKQ
jgi:tetratricopeptide (TPR) repeat protein